MDESLDFLGRHAPYDRLPLPDLIRLAHRAERQQYPAGTVIVQADQERLRHLFVIVSGAVQVIDRGQVVDELGPGETFGHLSVLSGLAPPLSVIAATDTTCDRLPDPREVVEHPEVLTFPHYSSVVRASTILIPPVEPALRPVCDFMRPLISCRPDTPIRDAVALMTETDSSCIVVDTGAGLGIMTDSDCRRYVASGQVPPDAPVSRITTIPAQVIDAGATAATAFLEMVTRGVHHLVVVEPDGRPVGTTRVLDLSSIELRDPLRIRTAIEKATTPDQLAQAVQLLRPTVLDLFDSGVPVARISALIGAMTEAVLDRAIRLSEPLAELHPDYEITWLVLGSLARREPLLRSDVDTALVFRPRNDTVSPDQQALLAAAESVISGIEAFGLRRCPDGANASNRLFNRSFTSWLASTRYWIDRPESDGALLLSSMVADVRPITGLGLGRSLIDSANEIGTTQRFLRCMLDEALARRPPTGFVRDFVVEASGRHRGTLNLKRDGLGPVVALGRWIGVTTRSPAASTLDRLAHGAAVGLLTLDESETLQAAFTEMFGLLFRHDVEAARHGATGTPYLRPESLDTLSRRFLRESFRAISKVQTRLESEWVSRLP